MSIQIGRYFTVPGPPTDKPLIWKEFSVPSSTAPRGIPERRISLEGHLRIMTAAQPFLSGGISKTVNLPASTSSEEIEQIFVLAWKLGLKSIAVYRDGCKVLQPLCAEC